jgi:hypothetical protein
MCIQEYALIIDEVQKDPEINKIRNDFIFVLALDIPYAIIYPIIKHTIVADTAMASEFISIPLYDGFVASLE